MEHRGCPSPMVDSPFKARMEPGGLLQESPLPLQTVGEVASLVEGLGSEGLQGSGREACGSCLEAPRAGSFVIWGRKAHLCLQQVGPSPSLRVSVAGLDPVTVPSSTIHPPCSCPEDQHCSSVPCSGFLHFGDLPLSLWGHGWVFTPVGAAPARVSPLTCHS